MCYVKFDKELLKTGLSPRAMILYALIADRIGLSTENGWKDSFGTFCYYTMNSIAEEMNIDKRQAQRLIHELEAAELILRQRQKGNKPFKIYIAPVSVRGDKNVTPEMTKMSPLEVTKMSPESEQYNQTNISSSSSSIEELISEAEATTGRSLSEEGRKKIKNSILKNKDKIGNLKAYICSCVINTSTLESMEHTKSKYAPTYDIAEYESTSIIDFMDDDLTDKPPETPKT